MKGSGHRSLHTACINIAVNVTLLLVVPFNMALKVMEIDLVSLLSVCPSVVQTLVIIGLMTSVLLFGKIAFWENLLLGKILFGKLFRKKLLLGKTFFGKILLGKTSFGKNFFWKNFFFLSGKTSFGKNFFWEKLLLGKTSFGKNFFWEKLLLGKTSFGKTSFGKNFFWGKISFGKKNFFWEKLLLGKTSFGKIFFGKNFLFGKFAFFWKFVLLRKFVFGKVLARCGHGDRDSKRCNFISYSVFQEKRMSFSQKFKYAALLHSNLFHVSYLLAETKSSSLTNSFL